MTREQHGGGKIWARVGAHIPAVASGPRWWFWGTVWAALLLSAMLLPATLSVASAGCCRSPAAGPDRGSSLSRDHNILVMGTDAGQRLTDVLLLVHLDRETRKARVLWIPRDTRVFLPVRKGSAPRPVKVNSAHAYGGVALLQQTVLGLTGVRADEYVKLDFAAFKKVVDLLGGVSLQVAKPMHYQDRRAGLYIRIPAGRQHLNGENALKYVRFRDDGQGDIGRIRRQQHFVATAFASTAARRAQVLALLPKLLASVQTNITPAVAATLCQVFLQPGALSSQSLYILPGQAQYIQGVSYWIHDPKRTKALMASFR